MPEDLNFGVSSNWESFSEGSLIDFVNKGAAVLSAVPGTKTAASIYELSTRASNNNTFISSFSHQTWRGTSPIEFSLKIVLSAFSSPKAEIMDKLEELLKLSLPEGRNQASNGLENTVASGLSVVGINDAQFIKAPPRDISLYIGTNLNFSAIVIPSINISFPNRTDKNGDYIFAEADITVRTSYTPQANMFKFESFQSDEERTRQQQQFLSNNPV